MFKTLVKYGDVIIITNALLNWIDISSKIIPLTSDFIQRSNFVKIISARGEFSNHKSDDSNNRNLNLTQQHSIV
jgi:hypothetical protein